MVGQVRELVGNIFVKLKRPKVTGEFGGVKLYDYLFVRLNNIYTPFFNLYHYGEFVGQKDEIMKSHYIANIFSENYRKYVKEGLWSDVETVKVEKPDNPVTAIVLKALNVIKKSNINKKYIRLFDMRLGVSSFEFISNDREKKVFGVDYAREILHDTIASYLSGKSTIMVGDSSTPFLTPLEISALKNINFDKMDYKGNLIVSTPVTVEVSSPVLNYTRLFLPYGKLQMRVIFSKGFYWYNPPFSSRIIYGLFNVNPHYDYNFRFINSNEVCNLKLSKFSVPRKIPVLKKPESNEVSYTTVINNKLYSIIKCGTDYCVAEFDLNNIVSRGAKSIAYKCPSGSTKPITNITKQQLEILVKTGF